MAARMHPDEVPVDETLVRRLLHDQHPQWARLPLAPVEPAGTDNALYRLGDDLVARLPRIHWAVGQVEKEATWLPRLAPLLPLPITVPVAAGEPGHGYPWRWSVCRWLEGETADAAPPADPAAAADDLAGFVAALQRVDATGGPGPGGDDASRGEPLAERDAGTRASIAALDASYDAAALTAVWEVSLRAPVWDRAPVWFHGDLDPRNLVVRDGRLTGVIDFGCLGVGDPACDVAAAWKVLPASARSRFRAGLDVDGPTWERSRGWVLTQAVAILSYYTEETNAVLVLEARRWLAELLAGGG